MDYIIRRPEALSIQNEKHWILLYGKRKVGSDLVISD